LSPNSKLVASASDDNIVRVCDARTGTLYSALKGHSKRVFAIFFSPNSKLIASASDDKTIRLWDIPTGTLQSTLKRNSNGVSVAFSPNGELVAVASYDTIIRLWDIQTGTLQNTFKGHSGDVRAIAFSPNSELVASASDDQTIRLWDVKISVLQQTQDDYSTQIKTLALSTDGRRFASASSDCMVRLWDADTGLLQHAYPVDKVVKSMFFNVAGSCLRISGGPDIELEPLPFHPSLTQSEFSYRLAENRSWITWNNHKVLWLPTEYRPSCSIFKDNVLFIGTNSGRVIFIRFDPSISPL
jgi:WD40 repeat protein